MKRILALLTAVLLLIGLFSGCKGKGSDNTSSKSKKSSTAAASEIDDIDSESENSDSDGTEESGASGASNSGNNSKNTGTTSTASRGNTGTTSGGKKIYYTNDLGASGKSDVVNNCYTSGYPIAKSAVTFNVMIKDYTNQADYSAMKINEFLKNKMNIKINWTIIAANDVTSRQILAYTSGNMPDLFIGMAPHGIAAQWTYAEQGLLLKLDSYIDKFAPNTKRLFKDEPAAKYSVTAQDGNIYSMPLVNSEREKFVYQGLYINKNWMSKLKLSLPKTTTDFMKILTAFLNNDPNSNGKKDEIPLCLTSDNMAGIIPACLYGPFGLAVYGGNAGSMIDKNGKVQINSISNNYKTALTYYKTLYKRGLIDSEWFTNDTAILKNKLSTSVATVGAFVSSDPLSLMSAARFKEYTLVPAFKDACTDKATWSITGLEHTWGEWFIVTKACKYPEVAVRMADYFYSLEGTLTARQGPQGYNWDVNSDGSIYMTDAYYKGTHASNTLTPGYSLPHYLSPDYTALTDLTVSSLTPETRKLAAQASKDLIKTYLPAAPAKIFPSLIFYDSDQKADKEVESEHLNVYQHTLRKEFISGDTDIGQFWDNYVGVCKNLGCENSQYYAQVAYDRYVKYFK